MIPALDIARENCLVIKPYTQERQNSLLCECHTATTLKCKSACSPDVAVHHSSSIHSSLFSVQCSYSLHVLQQPSEVPPEGFIMLHTTDIMRLILLSVFGSLYPNAHDSSFLLSVNSEIMR